MEADNIVPGIIPNLPTEILKVTYNNDIKVELGNEIRAKLTKDRPEVWWQIDKDDHNDDSGGDDAYYTLAMIDPDAPIRMAPLLAEVNHWLVCNISGNDINGGRVISEYRGCGPPRGTGQHRYIFLLYKQNGLLDISERTIPTSNMMSRLRFSIKKFVKKYNLIDKPIAGNFFKSQWYPDDGNTH